MIDQLFNELGGTKEGLSDSRRDSIKALSE